MNKIRKYIPKIVILDTAIYIWIFVMLHLILQCFGLKFREWVYWMSVLLMMMGFITGIIQLILKLKKRIVKIYMQILLERYAYSEISGTSILI